MKNTERPEEPYGDVTRHPTLDRRDRMQYVEEIGGDNFVPRMPRVRLWLAEFFVNVRMILVRRV